jgi:alkyl hydroperoxide reductase subunit AhpC
MHSDFPQHAAPKAFGIYDERRESNRRFTFLIDKEGVIRNVIDDTEDMDRHSRETLEIIASWG